MRGVPHEKRDNEEPVVAIELRLDRRDDQKPHWDRDVGWGWDWQYDLTRVVTTPEHKYRGSGAQCNWSSGLLSHIVPDLGCYIDCDGGDIAVRRVPGRAAVDVLWDAKSWLRMSACGGGGESLRAGSSSKTFRDERTARQRALAMLDADASSIPWELPRTREPPAPRAAQDNGRWAEKAVIRDRGSCGRMPDGQWPEHSSQRTSLRATGGSRRTARPSTMLLSAWNPPLSLGRLRHTWCRNRSRGS